MVILPGWNRSVVYVHPYGTSSQGASGPTTTTTTTRLDMGGQAGHQLHFGTTRTGMYVHTCCLCVCVCNAWNWGEEGRKEEGRKERRKERKAATFPDIHAEDDDSKVCT